MAKSNTKLTNLLSIEKDIQAKWTIEKVFEEDAPDLNDANTKRLDLKDYNKDDC